MTKAARWFENEAKKRNRILNRNGFLQFLKVDELGRHVDILHCFVHDPSYHRNRCNGKEGDRDMTQTQQREMALRKRPQDVRHPAFVVRAPDPNNRGRWITLGYAWARKNGEEGFSV